MNLFSLLVLTVFVVSPGTNMYVVNYQPQNQGAGQPFGPYFGGQSALISEDSLKEIEMRQFDHLPELISDPRVTSVRRLSEPSLLSRSSGGYQSVGGDLFNVVDSEQLREIVASDDVTNVYRMSTPIPLTATTAMGGSYLNGGQGMGRMMINREYYDMEPSVTYINQRGVGGYENVNQFMDVPYVERSYNTYEAEDAMDIPNLVVSEPMADVNSMIANAQTLQLIDGPAVGQPLLPPLDMQMWPPSFGPVSPPLMQSMGIPPMMSPSIPPVVGGSSQSCGGGCCCCQQTCEPETLVQIQRVPVPVNVPYPVPSPPIIIEKEEPEVIITTTTTPAPMVTTTQVIVRETIMKPVQTYVEPTIVTGETTSVRVLEPAIDMQVLQPTSTMLPIYQTSTALMPMFQTMPMCIPTGGQLGYIQGMLAQALAGQSVPDQYQVLHATRVVDDQVNCRIALQLAANMCRSYNLASPLNQNQWTLSETSPIACPTTVPMQLPYCTIGAF